MTTTQTLLPPIKKIYKKMKKFFKKNLIFRFSIAVNNLMLKFCILRVGQYLLSLLLYFKVKMQSKSIKLNEVGQLIVFFIVTLVKLTLSRPSTPFDRT